MKARMICSSMDVPECMKNILQKWITSFEETHKADSVTREVKVVGNPTSGEVKFLDFCKVFGRLPNDVAESLLSDGICVSPDSWLSHDEVIMCLESLASTGQ